MVSIPKFYILIFMSYSVSIPFSIHSIYRWISAKLKMQSAKLQFKVKSYLPNLFLTFTIFYLIFLVRPALLGQLGGTFKPHEIPKEYITLKNFIISQPGSFNTLWIPKVQRYGFSSESNQAVSSDEFLEAYSIPEIKRKLQDPGMEKEIKSLNIKYIIVPYDSQKELFLKDRKYDSSLYKDMANFLQNLDWIGNEVNFGDI